MNNIDEKIIREQEFKIIQYSSHRQLDFEYAIFQNGKKLFGWNNPKIPIEYLTKILFKKLQEIPIIENEK